MKTDITRRDEEKFLKLKIAGNSIFDAALSFDEIIDSIGHGNLSLEVSDDDGTKIIDDSSIKEIKKIIPRLLKIVNKPRSFIKSLEEKVPVETAKRINHKAIAKLSQDSNDWYARTVLSVKPKNIVSDINEGTIDLYENRFICSLIDRISKLLAQARQFYDEQLKTLDDNSAINAINREYQHNTNSFTFYNKISKNMYSYHEDSSYRNKVKDERESIKKIEKKIRLLKRSDFYRTLHKKRKVVDPIQKTNILMFEYNYNQAYKLWKYLNQNNQDEKLDLEVEFEEGETEAYYKLYSLVCVFAVLHDLGFVETSKNKISFDRETRKITVNPLTFRRGIHTIKLSMDENCIKNSLTVENSKEVHDFYIYPRFTDFESMSRSVVDDYSETLLNGLVDNKKCTTTVGKYAFVSINLNRCSEDNSYSNKVYRRFYSIGNNYSPDEAKENIDKWGNYKTGIAIVSPVQLRSNFLKIEKIFNYHLLKTTNFQNELTSCPLCGGKNIRMTDTNNYMCHDCDHNISITYCNDCDPKHKKPIVWVKYINEKFLENDEVVKGLSDMSTYYKLSKIETIMGEKATTAFELEKEVSGWKLKTICPYCGIKLGDKSESNK